MAPRLRDDLVATIIEEDGVTCVEVTDPSSSASFRFYDFEYALAQQLNGQPLQAVVEWASLTYGVELGPEALDAFIEKLTGLGFLVGGSSGAQPAVVVPRSSSSSAHAFAEVATTVAGEAPPLLDVPGVEAFAAEIAESVVDDEATVLPGVPVFANAVAPEGLISGDATEYRLKDTAASGLWQRPETGARSPAPAGEGAPATPRATERVPPGLEVLGGPLPPPPRPGRTDAPEAPAESPLSAIAHVISSVDTSGPAPVGALDAAGGSGSARVVPTFPSIPVTAGLAARPLISPLPDAAKPVVSPPPPVGPVVAGPHAPAGEPLESPSRWAAELVDEVDRAAPPVAPEPKPAARPELIVMPPTPAPLGADPSVAVPLPPRRSGAAVVLVLLAGAAAAAVWFLRPTAEPTATPTVVASAPVVHVVSPQPTTFYRWFEALGTVSAGRDDTLSFAKAGRLQDAMPPGTTFAAGEVLARLKGVSVREQLANKIRARVAYLEQLRESSRAAGDAAVRQAETKLTAKRKELAEAQAWQAELEIRAKVAGEIAQLLVDKRAVIPAGAPVFQVRAAGPQATFPLTTDDVARARGLGFCRVETVPGTARPGDGAAPEAGARAIDCAMATPSVGEARLVVDLANAGGVAPGTQVRLASARYDAVFPVPRAAVVRQGEADRVWIAAGQGRSASSRPIETAATIDDLTLVSRGLSVGDAVIVDPPGTLKDGAEINVAR